MGSAAAILESLGEAVRAAGCTAEPLCIEGGNTKSFYGRVPRGKRLSVAEMRGIIAYEPTELVITAWAGTPLTEIERALAEHGQMLAFEPPHFGPGATLGGMLACALSGPRRPYAGGVRDSVLGLACITGAGEVLRFGGRVMKNVAGFDVSRLMAGAMGTLGIVVEASIRVLPIPETELTGRQAMSEQQALERMNAWAGQPLPLSAACFDGRELFVRLSGHGAAVAAARKAIGGVEMDDAQRYLRRCLRPPIGCTGVSSRHSILGRDRERRPRYRAGRRDARGVVQLPLELSRLRAGDEHHRARAEARGRGELWLSPWLTAGFTVGASVLERNN